MEKMADGAREIQQLQLTLKINGKSWSGAVPAYETLLECIRQRLGLTGTKRSCESQVCGACTVLVDDQPISSCNYLAWEANGKNVLTIEGLAQGEVLDPLQEAFLRNIGAQCGFCTPGQIMAAKGLLLSNPTPTRDQIAEWLSGNICRCGAYPAIVASIHEAAAEMAAPDQRS
jgi:aerobic-type carbon monoxide dehydrogenase small subunit (CoxS/CutS family)